MVKNYSNRTRKHMTVVAYDIANDIRRDKTVKLLEKYGQRINYSVFECMLTRQQRKELQQNIEEIINEKEDQIVLYNICVDCYAKTTYLPSNRERPHVVVVA